MPTGILQAVPRFADFLRRRILKQRVKLIHGIVVFLSASVENTINVALALHFGWDVIDIANTS